jgi:hypothetical protein
MSRLAKKHGPRTRTRKAWSTPKSGEGNMEGRRGAEKPALPETIPAALLRCRTAGRGGPFGFAGPDRVHVVGATMPCCWVGQRKSFIAFLCFPGGGCERKINTTTPAPGLRALGARGTMTTPGGRKETTACTTRSR